MRNSKASKPQATSPATRTKVASQATSKPGSKTASVKAVSKAAPAKTGRGEQAVTTGATASTTLERCLQSAFLGNVDPLETLLLRFSKLPGSSPNMELARSFADLVSTYDTQGLRLAEFFATMNDDAAPATTAREYLPMVGVHALGLLGAKHDKHRMHILKLLEALAEDFRFRVREAVPDALAEIGRVRKAALIDEVTPWCDGYFQTAAVLRAITDPRWLHELHSGDAVVEVLRGAFRLLKRSTRSMLRYPGYKALVETLGKSLFPLAIRFGDPVVQEITTWPTQTSDPQLREMVRRVTDSPKLKQRFGDSIGDISTSLENSKTPPRDPTLIRHGTRGRGKKRKYARDGQ